MLKTYRVEIVETYRKTVTIVAESEIAAKEEAIQLRGRGALPINMDDDLDGVEFYVEERNTSMCNEGDTVYAIIESQKRYQLEVIEATVAKVTDRIIILDWDEIGRNITNVSSFPRTEWGKSIFSSKDEAQHELAKRERK